MLLKERATAIAGAEVEMKAPLRQMRVCLRRLSVRVKTYSVAGGGSACGRVSELVNDPYLAAASAIEDQLAVRMAMNGNLVAIEIVLARESTRTDVAAVMTLLARGFGRQRRSTEHVEPSKCDCKEERIES